MLFVIIKKEIEFRQSRKKHFHFRYREYTHHSTQLPTKGQHNNRNPLTNRLQTTRQVARRVYRKASMTEQSL